MSETDGLEKDAIYIRRGTKSEKAKSEDIERLIHRKIKTIFKEGSNLKLDEHLSQLKKLYNELPKKIKILVRKGEPSSFERFSQQIRKSIGVTDDEYEEKENPNCPEESYEAFILRMVENKKLKIEKVMDLK